MISLGDNKILSVYKGSTIIDKVFKGSALIYKKNLLPMGYQQVEYLESNGLRGMSTGFIATSRNIKAELKLYVVGAPTSEMDIFCNNYSPDGTASMTGDSIVLGQVASSLFLYTNGDTNNRHVNNGEFKLKSDNLIQLDFNPTTNKKTSIVNGVSIIGAYTTNIVKKGYPFYIMGSNGYRPMLKGNRLYYTKIWQDDILVRDLIPCYRLTDNMPGVYDLVGKTFYSNTTSGDYIVGPNIS